MLSVRFPGVELRELSAIDNQLTHDVEDWVILAELSRRGDIHGFITCDENMLRLPKELAVLRQTQLTMVVFSESGHDPLRATGLLLQHLPSIVARWEPIAQLWILRSTQKAAEDIDAYVARVADSGGISREQLLKTNQLSPEELKRPFRERPRRGA